MKSFLRMAGFLLATSVSCSALAAIEGNQVKIGVLTDMSSGYSDSSGIGSVIAAQMAVDDYKKQFNPDFSIEVVSADHQHKPDVGSSIARKWYDVDGVDMITDVPNSSVGLAVNQISEDKNKVFVNTGTAVASLTGEACTPNTVDWLYDTWELAHAVASSMIEQGAKSWFFLTADYAFGHSLEEDTAEFVEQLGGKVVGRVRAPLGTNDFSSFLLQAQSSKADIIALANAAGDTANSIKQAAEFGITQKQMLATFILWLPDVKALGLDSAQGLILAQPFYWDLNDDTRAWTKRFAALNDDKYPSGNQAGVYASVLHYLKAVADADTTDGKIVVEKMKELETDDPLFGKGKIRIDGRKIHPIYMMKVKKPEESSYPYDYFEVISTIPAEQAFRPVDEGGCYLAQQ